MRNATCSASFARGLGPNWPTRTARCAPHGPGVQGKLAPRLWGPSYLGFAELKYSGRIASARDLSIIILECFV